MKKGPYYRFYSIKNILRMTLNKSNQISKCQRNRQISRKINPTKIDTERNR